MNPSPVPSAPLPAMSGVHLPGPSGDAAPPSPAADGGMAGAAPADEMTVVAILGYN